MWFCKNRYYICHIERCGEAHKGGGYRKNIFFHERQEQHRWPFHQQSSSVRTLRFFFKKYSTPSFLCCPAISRKTIPHCFSVHGCHKPRSGLWYYTHGRGGKISQRPLILSRLSPMPTNELTRSRDAAGPLKYENFVAFEYLWISHWYCRLHMWIICRHPIKTSNVIMVRKCQKFIFALPFDRASPYVTYPVLGIVLCSRWPGGCSHAAFWKFAIENALLLLPPEGQLNSIAFWLKTKVIATKQT